MPPVRAPSAPSCGGTTASGPHGNGEFDGAAVVAAVDGEAVVAMVDGAPVGVLAGGGTGLVPQALTNNAVMAKAIAALCPRLERAAG